jgi:hypothetical protein
MKYFVLSMYVLWIGLTVALYLKEKFDENNTDNNRQP